MNPLTLVHYAPLSCIIGYYDNNIMPLLSMLNLVSISILSLDGNNFFQRGLMSLNIAFVEVGLRMALDSHLVSICYEQHFVLNILYLLLTKKKQCNILEAICGLSNQAPENTELLFLQHS